MKGQKEHIAIHFDILKVSLNNGGKKIRKQDVLLYH